MLHKSAIRVDATAPTLTVTNAFKSANGSTIFSGSTTSMADLTLSGSVSDFGSGVRTVQIYDGPTYLGNASVTVSGAWSFRATDLLNGRHNFSIKAVDAFGNVVTRSGHSATVNRDPVTLATTVRTDTESSPIAYGGATKDSTPTFTGYGVKGSTVEIW